MILEQIFRKISLKNGKARIWLEGSKLSEVGLMPGKAFTTKIDTEQNRITLLPSAIGNVVSSRVRKGKIVPIIDKSGPDIRLALDKCNAIKVTFFKEDGQSRVIIEGVINTADVLQDKEPGEERKLTSITFCAGAGISSSCAVDAGFDEIAGVEYNPKVGAENRFSEVYTKNHPDAVLFNVPLEELDANDLPSSDLWIASLDCTDFSQLSSSKTDDQLQTRDLYIHLSALFKQRTKASRPTAVLIENVPGFAEVGATLKLFYKKQGYSVTDGILNSLDYGSRTERKRYFFVACAFEGFTLPESTGRKETPLIEDGVIRLDNLNWVTPETDGTLKYFVERNNSITHNHKLRSYDITRDAYVGTIPKSHHKKVPENLIRHPIKDNTFAFLMDVGHLRYLHGIREDVYLGDNTALQIQSIGQGVCAKTFAAIVKKLHDFLDEKMHSVHKPSESVNQRESTHLWNEPLEMKEQYCFGF